MNIKQQICDLFEVYSDKAGVTRVVTPLEYAGSGDKIVVRVRPGQNGGYVVDENGEAVFNAMMAGGDISSAPVSRWLEEFHHKGPVFFDESDERLYALFSREEQAAPCIFRVAQAAQRLHAVATARVAEPERPSEIFRKQVKELMVAVATQLNIPINHEVTLPIAGDFKADHVIESGTPLLIITAISDARLLEAEVICMQYRADQRRAHIWAIADKQSTVGQQQFERANYYMDKALIFQQDSLRQLLIQEMTPPTVH